MEHAVHADTEHVVALRWIKTFMKTWVQIDPAPEEIDAHAVAALACRLYSRNMDLDAQTVAEREWQKDGGAFCYGVLQ